jgi:hypothetical protein
VEIPLLVLAILALVVRIDAFHGVLMVLHVLMALWVSYRWIRKRPIMCLFLLAFSAMYFPNPIAICFGWIPLEYTTTREIFYVSNVMQMVGLDLFLLATLRLRRHRLFLDRLPPIRITNPAGAEVCIIVAIALCAVTTALTISFVTGLHVDIFTIPKTWSRSYGEHNIYYLSMAYSFGLLPVAAFLLVLKPLPLQLPYWLAIAPLMVVHFMIMRNRTAGVALLIGIIVGVVLRNRLVSMQRRAIRKRFPFVVKLFLAAALPTLMFAGLAGKYLRTAYTIRDYRLTRKHWEYLTQETFATGGDLSFAVFLRHAIRIYPNQQPFLKGQSFYRLLFVPIPRFVWPTKPENTERYFAAALDPEFRRRNVTIPPGLVGDLYINFGYPGIAGMFVWGLLFIGERYRKLQDVLFLAGTGLWIFHWTRGNFSVPVVYAFVMWLFCLLAAWIVRPVTVGVAGQTLASVAEAEAVAIRRAAAAGPLAGRAAQPT